MSRESSSYRPAEPMDLTVRNAHMPQSVDDLRPPERAQLRAVLGAHLEEAFTSAEPLMIEAAEVVDAEGRLRYRLYGWDFGVGYLFAPEGFEVIAFGAQHDLEHWRMEQRPIFWAMDAALRKPDHGFEQTLEFCWWREECWEKLRGTTPGNVGSEPYIRKNIEKNLAENAK